MVKIPPLPSLLLELLLELLPELPLLELPKLIRSRLVSRTLPTRPWLSPEPRRLKK